MKESLRPSFGSPIKSFRTNNLREYVGEKTGTQLVLEHLGLTTWYAWLVLFSLILGYWMVDHAWTSSVQFSESEMIYTGGDNETADRLEKINPGSTSARIGLGIVGLIGLILPAKVRFQFSSFLFYPIAAFAGWLTLSFFWSVNPNYTLFKLVVLAVLGLTSLGLSKQFSLRQLGILFSLVSLAFIFVGVVAELSLGTLRVFGDYRFAGTSHPNTAAIYGSIVCLFAPLFMTSKSRWRAIGIAIFLLGFGCLVMTKSRTSLAALVVGLTASYILRAPAAKRTGLIIAAVSISASMLLLYAVAGAWIFESLGGIAKMGREEEVSTLTGRLPLWEVIIEFIEKRPLFGYGYLAFWDDKRVEYLSATLAWVIPHAHNMYLDITLDGGVIALAIFVFAVFTSLYFTSGGAWQTENEDRKLLFGLIVLALVNGSAESLFKLPGFPFFVVFTLLLRCLWAVPVVKGLRK